MRLVLALLWTGTAVADPKPPTTIDKPKGVVVPHIKGMSEAQRGVEITPSTRSEEALG